VRLTEAAEGWPRSEPVVTVCAYGTRSAKAALLLAEQGFGRVASLHGGMVRWAEEGLPAVEVMADRDTQAAGDDAGLWQGMDI
jgi:rhodanese-related sulfurtransferase